MKNYNVSIIGKKESHFTVKANNLNEAKKIASFNKRMEKHVGKTYVSLITIK